MKEEVRLHLERADDCIKDAELLMAGHRYSAVVGRAYYAMFHAATAALLKNGHKKTFSSQMFLIFIRLWPIKKAQRLSAGLFSFDGLLQKSLVLIRLV